MGKDTERSGEERFVLLKCLGGGSKINVFYTKTIITDIVADVQVSIRKLVPFLYFPNQPSLSHHSIKKKLLLLLRGI